MNPEHLLLRTLVGPEHVYDDIMREFLINSRDDLTRRTSGESLLQWTDLGTSVPWAYHLVFRTRGLIDQQGQLLPCAHFEFLLRFLPDYLRRADKFEMLRLIRPMNTFHPNIRDVGVCVQIYPGEPVVEIAESLHRLVSWKLRTLREDDALNIKACQWGRSHEAEIRHGLDDRPLFGPARTLSLQIEEVPAHADADR